MLGPSATHPRRGGTEAPGASRKHLEASWGPSETGGPFTLIKMQSNRRERPFYRRVAKVGRTKYCKTHGFCAGTLCGTPAVPIANTVTHAARNPTVEHCLGNNTLPGEQ